MSRHAALSRPVRRRTVRHGTVRRRRIVEVLVAALTTLVLLAWPGAPASAGGWAVGSLDELPAATAGETETVGFTILQHGVTPADLTDDVGIEIVAGDGTVHYFAATRDGAPGHFVATVTFPDSSGSYWWSIRMGWFGPQPLGTIDVASPGTAPGGSDPWPAVRWVTVVLTVALAAVSITDMATTRRRGRARVALG